MIALVLLAAAGAVPLGQAVQESIDANECRQRPGKGDIIVCATRNYRSPFRLPEDDAPFDPYGESKSVMNERVGWAAEGDVGTQSCSAVGPGGWTGCMVKSWKESRDQTQWKKTIPKRRW